MQPHKLPASFLRSSTAAPSLGLLQSSLSRTAALSTSQTSAGGTMGPKGDKRHTDPEHGGLSTGEKSAITRAVHEGRTIKFTDEHPEKKAAAEAYEKEVRDREKGGGGGSNPTSPRKGKK